MKYQNPVLRGMYPDPSMCAFVKLLVLAVFKVVVIADVKVSVISAWLFLLENF
jgi:hypothetical protein